MGLLSNFLGEILSGTGGSRERYPNGIFMTSDKEAVARAFLQHLEEVLDADGNYSRFFDIIKGPQGISTMKMWFKRFTEEELFGHNYADWLKHCTILCFENQGTKVLTDAGLTKLCKEVQNLL